MKKDALIFGYNDYACEISKNIAYKYNINIFRLNKETQKHKELQKFTLNDFDLSDEWSDLQEQFTLKEALAFCVLDDDAKNIFLTISLRSQFPNLEIIAVSKNYENVNKLTMAGATKVIPLVQTTASIISNILTKPITTTILHKILYEESELSIEKVKLKECNLFQNRNIQEIEWNEEFGVSLLYVNNDLQENFIFSKENKKRTLFKNDELIVCADTQSIIEFKKKIGA